MSDPHYYKFISLHNLRRFIDIVLNNRLYAAHYDELNDPMEGAYITSVYNANIINLIKTRKYKTRICSLTKDYRHTLLWSHYADGHKGCCLEVSAINKREKLAEINYTTSLPEVGYEQMEGRQLLSHKSPIWRYEEEVRYFRKTSFLNVKIHRIIFGTRVSRDDYSFYEKLIRMINSQIVVQKMPSEEIIDGFNTNN